MSADGKVVPLSTHQPHGIEGQVKARKLLDTCRNLTLKHLKTSLQAMLDNADDALFAMAGKAENNANQSLYFDSMRLVRLHRSDIEKQFYQQIETGFDEFWDHKEEQAQEQLNNELSIDDLSLVEETDLEESLAITNLVTKIKSNFGPAISAIEQRLEQIASHITIDDDTNPMGPKAICNAFTKVTQALDTELKIKLIIYKLFDHQLVADIGPLYDSINQEFIAAGVLPKIKARINRSQHFTPAAHGTAALPDTDVTFSPEEGDHYQASNDSGVFLANLQQLLSANRSTATAQGGSGSVATPSSIPHPPTPTQDVLSALTAIQLQPAILPAEGGADSVSNGIRSAMGAQLGIGEGQTVSLNSVDNDMIDVIAMMFEFILDDPNLPDAARALIGRLQIPMLKVAILDKEVFASKSHPARKLLNSLAVAGLGLEDEVEGENYLLAKMESIVNRILDEFKDDISLFENLSIELEEFMEERLKEEAQRKEETKKKYEAREQMELARTWVRETLKDALGDKQMPKEVLKIIMGPWHDVMTHTYLNEGDKSRLWKNQLRFIDVLAWSVQPKQLKVDRKKLGNIIKHLIASLRDNLQSIDYPAEKIERIFESLEPYHHASLYGLRVTDTPAETAAADTLSAEANEDSSQSGFYQQPSVETARQENPAENSAAADDDTPEFTCDEEMTTDQASIAAAIADMEEQMATLEELEASLDEPLAALQQEDEAEDDDSFDKEIMEDIVLAGWDAEDHIPEDQPEDEYLELARHLQAGKWVEFIDDDKKKVRAKLTWKSELLGEYTFTNWKFDVIADKTIYGLAADLRRGTARIIDDVPVLDRALSAVMNGLAKKAS